MSQPDSQNHVYCSRVAKRVKLNEYGVEEPRVVVATHSATLGVVGVVVGDVEQKAALSVGYWTNQREGQLRIAALSLCPPEESTAVPQDEVIFAVPVPVHRIADGVIDVLVWELQRILPEVLDSEVFRGVEMGSQPAPAHEEVSCICL